MDKWEQEQAHRVGREVQRLRKLVKLTAQQLADETERLGLKMTRQSISDLENGRRRYVTTAELAVLAAALVTPPVALLFPGPYDDEIDVVPTLKASQFDAAQWFSGLGNETFGVQSEDLNTARNLVAEGNRDRRQTVAEALKRLDQLGEVLARAEARDIEQTRIIEDLNRRIHGVADDV